MKYTLVLAMISAAALMACGDRGAATPERKLATAEIPATTDIALVQSERSEKSRVIENKSGIPEKEVALCAAEANIVKRLDCYDSLAIRHKQAPSTEITSAPNKGKWRTETDTDPLTDKSIHYASLLAESGTGRFGETVSLTVRCQNKKTEAYINWNSFLGTDGISVTTRIDKNPAKTALWSISTDHKASFMPSAAASIQGFIGATSFVANLTPYSESPITAIFDISGAGDALADIGKGCDWKS